MYGFNLSWIRKSEWRESLNSNAMEACISPCHWKCQIFPSLFYYWSFMLLLCCFSKKSKMNFHERRWDFRGTTSFLYNDAPLWTPEKTRVWTLNNALIGDTPSSALCKEMATNRLVFINIISKSKFDKMLTQYMWFFGGFATCGKSVGSVTTSS